MKNDSIMMEEMIYDILVWFNNLDTFIFKMYTKCGLRDELGRLETNMVKLVSFIFTKTKV